MSYKVSRGLNWCLTQWYLWQFDIEHLKSIGEEFNLGELRNNERKRQYAEIRKMFPDLYSVLPSDVATIAFKKWNKSAKACYYAQAESLPTYKKGKLIPVHYQCYDLIKDDGEVVLKDLRIYPKKDHEELSFILKTQKIDGHSRHVLEQLLAGNFKRKSAQVQKDKRGRWHIVIAYEKPLENKTELVQDRIVGVDLGISQAYYCAVNDLHGRINPNDSERLQRFRTQIKKRRRQIQSSYRIAGARKGKGKVYALKPVQRLADKEKNFRETLYHQYSRAIVEFAFKHRASIIQMEDLTTLKKNKQGDFILDGWAIADLQGKIQYKAVEYGMEVRYIDPQYTSQRCSKCGHIEPKNRESRNFVCLECGFSAHADYNAAKNISMDGIGEIIQKELSANHEQFDLPI